MTSLLLGILVAAIVCLPVVLLIKLIDTIWKD